MISIGSDNLSGTDSMVRILWVTFSPTAPSPRVAATAKIPFLYSITILSPSILCSHTYAIFFEEFALRNLFTLASNSKNSSGVKQSFKDHCFILWRTFVRSEEHTSELQSHVNLVC